MQSILFPALQRLLLPAARLCLRYSISFQELSECLKRAFIAAAKEHLSNTNAKTTVSRLSVMTGIHRKDVDRLMEDNVEFRGEEPLIARVIGQWQTDKRFLDRKHRPKKLDFGTANSSFHKLVSSVKKELNPATVLFELERTGIVEREEKALRLVKTAYSPSDRLAYGLDLLGQDTSDLFDAVLQNLDQKDTVPNLHARTVFDRVRPQQLADIRAFLVKEGHELHTKIRTFLSKHDQDINPDPAFRGEEVTVVLESYSLVKGGKIK